jgi:aryl sulfotransferase
MRLVREPTVETRTWAFDSRRWGGYRPRPDDIVIATYAKSGTTWMQRIVGMLVFASAEPKPVMELSVWPDARGRPVEQVFATMEAQTHRRFLKAHLPFASLPIYDEVRYIHVARDGRDACMSFHNQVQNFNDGMLENLSAGGMADESIARPFPPPMDDPADFFHRWMTEGVQEGVGNGLPLPSWFEFERSWWDARDRDNVLLVHYADLSADLEGEMRRVATFLGIGIEDGLWPEMVDAAGFESMRRDGDRIMGGMTARFRRGSGGFFFKGTDGRWKGVFREADLALYDTATARLPPDCAAWLADGRLGRAAA